LNVPLTPLRFLRYAEEQFPRRLAVVCGTERFSYSEFASRIAHFAGALRALGVQPGDRVAFLSTNCHSLLEAYYAVIEAGAILLPLNVRLAPPELAYILNDSGSKLLFLQEMFLPVVESFRSSLNTVEAFYLTDAAPQAPWLAPQTHKDLLSMAPPLRRDIMSVDENSLAELFYTSGTSANPKGVALTHRNIYLHAFQACMALRPERDHVELHTIPLFHANGWGAAHYITFIGGTHVMVPKFDPAEIFRLIQKERVQTCSLVPTMATALVNCPERVNYDLTSLRRIMLGGAASSPTIVREVEEKLGCTCLAGYGLTETSPVATLSSVKPDLYLSERERIEMQAMTGYAIPGVELRVVDANDRDVPRDGKSIGEILVRGDNVMDSYWKQPESTKEVLRGGWLHTGDMAVWNSDNYLLILDRKKDIIVSGGENISSLEVEKALIAHPSVLECAVIPVPDQKWGEVPHALVVLKPGAQATDAELIEFCRTRIAHYKCPHTVEFVAELPKTGTGKILKRDIRKKYWSGSENLRPKP
jgi:fatty-acyl-CoA synthase